MGAFVVLMVWYYFHCVFEGFAMVFGEVFGAFRAAVAPCLGAVATHDVAGARLL
jgi:hypothetical protein